MLPISGFILICLLFSAAYFVGLLTFITDYEENKCEMTYMFQYPQFVRIHNKLDASQNKYVLYAYSEGHFTERVRQMYFDGIPVLFIPGNAGSHKQVRSFASVALRKALDDRPGFHFDFFTIDLNSELSGLNGALLGEQTQYVNQSIINILELYKNSRSAPKSVVLIGHSMGGIIARSLLTSMPSNSELLPLLITLGTPHARPAVISDVYMMDFYKKLQHNVSYPETSTIVAISGGYNDFLVSPHISYARHFKNFHVVTTTSPKVWLPVDHLCILWCKQLVLAVTRSLFDSVNMETRQISLNSSYHRQVFQHHLAKHSGIKIRQANRYNLPVKLGKSSKWIENLQRHYTVSLVNGTKSVEYHMIRLLNEPTHEFLTILAINLEVTDWVFACAAVQLQGQTRICSEGQHLSHLSEIVPSIKHKRRMLELNLHELKRNNPEITHIVIRVLPTREPMFLHVDIHGAKEQTLEVNLPRWWSFGLQSINSQTPERIVSYELILPQLQHIIQSYKLYVQPLKCSNINHHAVASLKVPWADHNVHQFFTQTDKNPLHVRLYASRPHGLNASLSTIKLTLDPFCTYSVSIKSSLTGMLSQIARTYSTLLIANITAVILLVFRNQLKSIETTGSCSLFFYAIKYGVKPYYILTLVKLASKVLSMKGISTFLPAPDWQLIADEGIDFFVLPLLLYICSVGIVWLIAVAVATTLILCEATFHKIASKFLARTVTGAIKLSDWLLGGLHKLPCIVASALICLSISTCGGLALCLGCAFYFLKLTQMSQDYIESLVLKVLKYLGSKLKNIFLRKSPENAASAHNESNEPDLKDRVLEITEELPHQENEIQNCDKQVAEILSSDETDSDENGIESYKTKGENDQEALGVLETEGPEENMEIQEIEELNESKEEPQTNDTNTASDGSDDNAIFFHFSIFLLWCIVTLLNIPSVLTWAHNFRYNSRLQPDPSFLPGIVLSLCALPLWQLDLPKTNIYMYDHLGHVFNVLAGISLIYAPISMYRLVYIITVAVVIITLHQLLAPRRSGLTEEAVEESGDAPENKMTYNKVKAKWE